MNGGFYSEGLSGLKGRSRGLVRCGGCHRCRLCREEGDLGMPIGIAWGRGGGCAVAEVKHGWTRRKLQRRWR